MSVVGIAFAVAVLFVGLAFIDVLNVLIDEQFTRGDAAGRDADLRRAACRTRRPRRRASAGRHGARADRGACRCACAPASGRARSRSPACPAAPQLNRVFDRTARRDVAAARRPGALEDARARSSTSQPGDAVQVEVLEGTPAGPRRAGGGARRRHASGLQAYMRIDARARGCCAKAPTLTGAARDARPGDARSLLCGGQDDAGRGRRRAARRRRCRTSARRWPRT